MLALTTCNGIYYVTGVLSCQCKRITRRMFQSLNGVWINEKRLPAMHEHTLQDQEVVQLGVPAQPGAVPEFQWKFFKELRVKKICKSKQGGDSHDVVNSQASSSSVLSEKSINRKRAAAGMSNDENQPSSSTSTSPKRARRTEALWSPSADMARRLAEQQREADAKLREQEERLAEMQRMLKEKEDAEERMREQLLQRERDMQEELHKQKAGVPLFVLLIFMQDQFLSWYLSI